MEGATRLPPCGWASDGQGFQVYRLLFEHPGGLLTLLLVVVEPGAGRDELADDHVLLQPAQPIDLAGDRGLGEDTRGLLERGRREPRGGVQRGLDQAEQNRLGRGRLATLGQRARVGLLVLPLRDDLAREQAGVARRVDADLSHHLANYHLDVLVIDIDALAAVDLLDLVHEEGLDRLLAQDVQQLLRRDGALGYLLARLDDDLLAVAAVELWANADLVRDGVLANLFVDGADSDLLGGDRDLAGVAGAGTVALGVAGQLLALHYVVFALDQDLHLGVDRVRDLDLLFGGHAPLARTLRADDLELPVDLRDDRLALGDTSLEQLLHAGQTLGDVHAGLSAGVERSHGQLGARLADRLRGDDAHRFTDLDDLAGGQVAAVARAADALAGLANEHGTHLDGDSCRDRLARRIVTYRRSRGDQHLAVDHDVLRGDAAGDPLEYRIALSALRADVANPDSVGGTAVLFAHDDVLGDVDETPRQIARVGGAEGGVCETFAGAVG